jgi:hypothetical protein
MQRLAMLFLILILTALPVLSIATSIISASPNTTRTCQQHTEMQVGNATPPPDCCQLLDNHCASGQCDCDTGHFSSSLTSNLSTFPVYYQQSVFQQSLSLGLISYRSNSLYRPPRIIL